MGSVQSSPIDEYTTCSEILTSGNSGETITNSDRDAELREEDRFDDECFDYDGDNY